MILSRRSFLKVAGLSAVAVASASMFTGCGSNVFTTPVEFVADPVDETNDTVKAVVKALNDNKTATSILGHSDLHGEKNQDKKHFTDLLAKLAKSDEKAGKSTGYNKVVVVSTEMSKKKDSNGNDYYYVKVTIGKKPEKTEENK